MVAKAYWHCLWGGALVQWESKRQPFAALSSTEAELIGYVDALTMGESLQVILNILEHNALVDDGQFEIRGDNLSGHPPLEAEEFRAARATCFLRVACGTCSWSRIGC